MTMNRGSHTTQQQEGTSEKMGNMPQCGYLMHSKRMNPTSPINYLQLNNNMLRSQNEESANASMETL